MDRTAAKSSGSNSSQFILSQYFKIGFLQIRYYSLTMVSALVAAYLIAWQRAKRAGLAEKVFEDLVFWAVLVGFICARVYYVIFYWSYYAGNYSEIYKVWHGGLAIYGGLIGGMVTIYFFARHNKLNFFKITDILALALPLAQAIGRLGNFFNYEAFGKPTNLPWKIFIPWSFRPENYKQYSYFQPTFAYEMLWNILVFIGLWLVEKYCPRFKAKVGSITGLYLILYSIGRFFIEGMRLDSAYLGHFPLAVDQIVALFMILLGIAIVMSRKYEPQNQ